MVETHDYLHSERAFLWFKILLVLATIIIFGYLFCASRPCY